MVFLALALLAALSQMALLAAWRFGPGYLVRLGPSAVWMVPTAVVLVYAVPVSLLFLLSRIWPRAATLPLLVGLLSLLAVVDLALMERRLTLWAIGLLALGVGVQVGRFAEAHRERALRVMRGLAIGLVLLVVTGAVAVESGLAWRERRAVSGLPNASKSAPNVLLIILDTVRALNLSLYDYSRETTPVLDSLAPRATVFDHAVVPATWSLPSHGSLFTGHWPHALESWWSRPRIAPHPTLAEVMSEHGYRTGAVVANWFTLGWESGLAKGFLYYDDLGVSVEQILRGSAIVRWLAGKRGLRRALGLYDSLGRRGAAEIRRSFLRWLDRDRERPFFAFLNFLDAHSPYLPPPPFDTVFGPDVSEREPIVMEELNRTDDPGREAAFIETAAYDGSIAHLDREIGRLLAELDLRGALENTLVIITSDHGEELGEHGVWGHGVGLHAQSVHVPLMMLGPGVPANLRIRNPSSVRHVAATIADLAGLIDAPFAGRSLARFWRDGPVSEDNVVTELGAVRSIYYGGYHYIEATDRDAAHLYDVIRDPTEQNDLMQTEVADVVLPPILERLATFSAASGGSVERATGRD